MATNWKNEVLKYYPKAFAKEIWYDGYIQIEKCDSYGAREYREDKAWKQTYFNIVKSAPVKSKFTKGEIVNHNDYLAHKDVFNALRSAPYLSDSDEAFMADIDKKLLAYERLQTVNNANSSKGGYPNPSGPIGVFSIQDATFLPLYNATNDVVKELTNPNITASKLQRVERQLKWLWAFVIIIFLAFIFAIIALSEQ